MTMTISGPYMFGVGATTLSRREVQRRRRAAATHGARFVLTSGAHWFELPNLGEPHNSRRAAAILAALADRGR